MDITPVELHTDDLNKNKFYSYQLQGIVVFGSTDDLIVRIGKTKHSNAEKIIVATMISFVNVITRTKVSEKIAIRI